VIESDWHRFRISVGEDQVVWPPQPWQDVCGLPVDDADAVPTSPPCYLKLGKAYVLGVAFDRLDERIRTVREAER
jgi:hypothetical protein